MEFRRFLNWVIRLPCQIVRTGRRLVFRLLNVNEWTPLLLEGSRSLKQLRLWAGPAPKKNRFFALPG